MKRLLTLSSIVVLLGTTALLLYSSCNKKETQSITKKDVHAAYRLTVSPANSLNPYDYVGRMHNALLDDMINNGLTTSNFGDTWLNSAITFLADSTYDTSTIRTTMTSTTASYIFAGLGTSSFITPQDQLKYMYTNHLITLQQNTYINSIFAAIDSATINSNTPDDAVTIICGRIKLIEADMQANVTDANQLQTLLATSSIARYSLFYWIDQTTYSSPWGIWGVPNPLPPPVGIWKWVAGDLAGGAGASVSWGIAAIGVAGPTGWGAAVIGGAIGGSIGALL